LNDNYNKPDKYRIYDQMISSFYEAEQRETNLKLTHPGEVKIEPYLMIQSNEKQFKVGYKIGNKQMYKIKNIADFYNRMKNKETYKYGIQLEFVHSAESFEKDSQPMLDFIMKHGEIIKYVDESLSRYHSNNRRTNMLLTEAGIDEFFDIMKNSFVNIEIDGTEKLVQLADEEPKIRFEIREGDNEEYFITTKTDGFDFIVVKGKEYIYFLQGKKLYRCTEKFEKSVLKLLNIFRVNFTNKIPFKKSEFAEFYSLILPLMKENITLNNIDEDELKQYIPKQLKVKVYLDVDSKNYINAEIKFIYDEFEFSPFDDVQEDFPRNIVEESKALDMFSYAGFMFDSKNNKLILANEEKIYDFLKTGIDEMFNKYEILATDAFRKREIISPKISSVGVKIENNLLSIDLSNINFEKSELEEIMKKYKTKKRFHRLKNGQFVDLEDNDSLETILQISESTNVSFKELSQGIIKVPVYRSLYLDRILKHNNVLIKQNEEYKNLIDNVNGREISEKISLPNSLKATLREYQVVGYDWLNNLDDYKLGGILADDMGLGKTVQMLAVILKYAESFANSGQIENQLEISEGPKTQSTKHLPSLVICPSSLTLNWQDESKRFAPTLKTLVISGSYEERKKKIQSIEDYDLIITSYDLLKRDIDIYDELNYTFRFLIADEAQYIKNNNTQNARAIKRINSITRYALTGTPIENSLSELWSIFDFIMPGYLYSYNRFKTQYETPIVKEENQAVMNRLKEMIGPFVLRRVKEKVLTELPDKTITILNNEMEDEQLKLYLSFMQSAKKQAKEEIEANGVQNSQIKILALLMRLRQICCHPGLFIENYNDGSKKLSQCVEIIQDAVDSGHKILLFSGYASMFPYIKNELDAKEIKYFTLTGATKVSERMELVNEFNSNDDVKVFLISLKAGGTGLNLIGADMVIHYDPWWNISIENQATDRAYRIGQKRNVQVYKLITKNSIEEKIYQLQEKKAKLADNLLSTNQTFISHLSEDEIMNLFE